MRSRRNWCRNVVLPDRRMPVTAVALPGNRSLPKTRRGVKSGGGFRTESASWSPKACRQRAAAVCTTVLLLKRIIYTRIILLKRRYWAQLALGHVEPQATPRWSRFVTARSRHATRSLIHRVSQSNTHRFRRETARGAPARGCGPASLVIAFSVAGTGDLQGWAFAHFFVFWGHPQGA